MWGIGNSSFFLANNALTQAITFPIVSSGPSAISALWGVVLYKEIKGTRNFILLGFGFGLALAGSIMCGISK
jgi:glucose uptake protein GlcU